MQQRSVINVLSTSVALLLASCACGQTSPLEFIPRDAAAAVAVRNVRQLGAKGDKLLDEVQSPGTFKVSTAVPMLMSILGINRGLDQDSVLAVVIVDQRVFPEADKSLNRFIESLVFVLPFSERSEILKNFAGLGELAEGELRRQPVSDSLFNLESRVLAWRKKHLYLGFHEKAVQSVLDGVSLRQGIDVQRQRVLESADVVALFGSEAWGEFWTDVTRELESGLRVEEDAESAKVADELLALASEIRWGIAAVSLDGGLDISLETVFRKDQEHERVAAFLSTLRGGDGASELNGLPAGNVGMAAAARGRGRRNALIARSVLKIVLGSFVGGAAPFSPAERERIVECFDSLWRDLNGSRIAVYRNEQPDRHGLFAAVAILDGEPAALLGQVPRLSELLASPAASRLTRPNIGEFKMEYLPRSERVGNKLASVWRIDPRSLNDEIVAQLREALGPDWNRILLLPEGQHVIMLVGSNLDLLARASKNVQARAAGLAELPVIRQSTGHLDPDRKVQVHFDLRDPFWRRAGLVGNDTRAGTRKTPAEPASAGLTVNPDRIQVDVWLPVSQLQVLWAIR